jgi:hypothetical protein
MEQRERVHRQTASSKWMTFVAVRSALRPSSSTARRGTVVLIIAGVIFLIGIALLVRDYSSARSPRNRRSMTVVGARVRGRDIAVSLVITLVSH